MNNFFEKYGMDSVQVIDVYSEPFFFLFFLEI